jgi:FkbM family methyltransferase
MGSDQPSQYVLGSRAISGRDFGGCAPNRLARTLLAIMTRLPANWLGLKLAMLLRRPVMARLRPDRPLDVELWGLRLRLYPCRNGCEKAALFTPQMYDRGELVALAEHIGRTPRRPYVFVDIGANVGLYSLFAASQLGAGADVVAFEPDPQSGARFCFNLACNPSLKIRFLPIAISDKAGSVNLSPHPRDRGGTRIVEGADPADGISAACEPLLEALARLGVTRIDALKIDIEGYEDRALLPFFSDAPVSLWPQLLIIEDTSELWRANLLASLAKLGYAAELRTRLNIVLSRKSRSS